MEFRLRPRFRRILRGPEFSRQFDEEAECLAESRGTAKKRTGGGVTSRFRSGTQSIERTLQLLRLVSTRGHFGWRLSDLATHCSLGRSTVHRLLACLVRERLVEQRASDRHYIPGPMLFELSLSLPRQYGDFLQSCAAPLSRLARRTRTVSYLMLRSGSDFVCAARGGSPALKAHAIEIGVRRPLMTAAGGIAILIALHEEEMRQIVERNLHDVARLGSARVRSLERVLKESQKHGFGIHQGQITPGVHAIGLAVLRWDGKPFASLTVVGSADALPASRVRQVVSLLKDETRHVAREADRLNLAI